MNSMQLAVLTLLLQGPSTTTRDEVTVIEAETLAALHQELSDRLAAVTPGTREPYVTGAIGAESPLPESDERNHSLNIVHRTGYSWAESHDRLTDFYIIVEGAGTLLTGGEMVDALAVDGRPGEWRAPRLVNADRRSVARGDLVDIPSGVPHQWELTDEQSVTYVIVKVLDRR